MSKRRDALRRGIRSLIHDTSRELADLEGREAPAAGNGGAGETPAVDDAAVPRDIRPSADPDARPFGEDAGGPDVDVEGDGLLNAEVMAVEVREIAARRPIAPEPRDAAPFELDPPREPVDAVPLEPDPALEAAVPATDIAHADAPDADAAPAEVPSAAVQEELAIAPPSPAIAEPVVAPDAGEAVHAEPAPRDETSAPARKRPARAASKKAAKGARARQPVEMPAGDALEGVDPAQAQSRKGVCVAYFVDHACWHVTNAYCNTALHVCVMRDCPVYHLHRDALERRFAGKYKHFW